MTLIIAQGGGFYGCAFMTSEKSAQEVISIVGQALKCKPEHPDGGYFILSDGVPPALCDQSCIEVREWAGNPQPTPIILFDTGHGERDMGHLSAIQAALG